jgi:dCTP deaminase
MTLSKADIQRELGYGELEIEYDDDLAVEPSSVDLHLGDEIKTPLKQRRDVKVDMEATYPCFETVKTPFTIPPHGFALAHTAEVVNIPDYLVGHLQGRSSVGRLGLFVENAGLVDAGFHGDLTLELYNAAPYPIELKEDMRIVNLTLNEHDTAPSQSYSADHGNKYNGQRGPTESCLYEDF